MTCCKCFGSRPGLQPNNPYHGHHCPPTFEATVCVGRVVQGAVLVLPLCSQLCVQLAE